VLGGATDVLYAGWGPIWNLADIAIGIGTVVATWRFVRNIPRPVWDQPWSGVGQSRRRSLVL